MDYPLTKRQSEILNFIKSHIINKGYAPSVREICSEVGLKSSSTVHSHLKTLEKLGYIKKDPSKSRSITVVLGSKKTTPTCFSQRLKQLRLSTDTTQEKLAKFIGVERSYIARYEANTKEPSAEKLKLIAIYFNVSADYLLGIINTYHHQARNSKPNLYEELSKEVLSSEYYEEFNIYSISNTNRSCD